MKTVPLHGRKAAGRVALVDDEDYDLVMQYRWGAWESPTGGVYATTNLPGCSRGSRAVLMHRLLTGYPLTDHRDCDGLNNQRSNLRVATTSQSAANKRKRRGSKSPFKGVIWNARSRNWRVVVKMNGEKRDLGLFADEAEAALAYDAVAREMHGEFARLNFPRPGEASALEGGNLSSALGVQATDYRPEPRGTSRYTGVFWDKTRRRWHAAIAAGGKLRHLGFFVSEIEAAIAYDDAARIAYGEQACLNFPDGVSLDMREQLRVEAQPLEAAARADRLRKIGAATSAAWARREPVACVCQECGGAYAAKRPGQSRYCGGTCSARARRRRNREARLASDAA